jgi:hypothetical protein
MQFSVTIPIPVLLNDILRTPPRHQSRIKHNGYKGKLGYKQLELYFKRCPKFKKPVIIKFCIYQTKKHPVDIDSCHKTLLDFLAKHSGIIVDDNHTGIKMLTVTYAKGFHKEKKLKVSIRE